MKGRLDLHQVIAQLHMNGKSLIHQILGRLGIAVTNWMKKNTMMITTNMGIDMSGHPAQAGMILVGIAMEASLRDG